MESLSRKQPEGGKEEWLRRLKEAEERLSKLVEELEEKSRKSNSENEGDFRLNRDAETEEDSNADLEKTKIIQAAFKTIKQEIETMDSNRFASVGLPNIFSTLCWRPRPE